MQTTPLRMDDVPALSSEAAAQCLDFLYALITAFENHYASELRQAHQVEDCLQQDLFTQHETDLGDDPSFWLR